MCFLVLQRPLFSPLCSGAIVSSQSFVTWYLQRQETITFTQPMRLLILMKNAITYFITLHVLFPYLHNYFPYDFSFRQTIADFLNHYMKPTEPIIPHEVSALQSIY